MALSLDMDVGDIINELFKKKKAKKGAAAIIENAPAKEEEIGESSATRQARDVIITTVFVIVVSVLYVMFYYIPKQDEIIAKTEKLKQLQEQRDGIATLDNQIKNRTKQLKNSRNDYITILSYFDKSKELEDLYKSVSHLATSNALMVTNIKILPPPPTPKVVAKNPDGTPKAPPPAKKYKDNKVYIELDGRYGNYMKFKKALLAAKNLLTIHNEVVSVIVDKKSGTTKVKVKLNLSTYTLDKEPYQEALNDD